MLLAEKAFPVVSRGSGVGSCYFDIAGTWGQSLEIRIQFQKGQWGQLSTLDKTGARTARLPLIFGGNSRIKAQEISAV
jgi:hypothetical protein